MTHEQQAKIRIAIAKFCPKVAMIDAAGVPVWRGCYEYAESSGSPRRMEFDPVDDLNACHAVEMTLDKDQLWEFASKLSCVMDMAPRRIKGMSWDAHQVSPTAAQRAEALYRTIKGEAP